MRQMKDSGIEWVGHIPEYWSICRLKYLIDDHFGGCWGEDPVFNANDLLCIRIADFDFSNQRVKSTANTLRNYTESQMLRYALQNGDLILEKSGGGEKTPVGRVVVFEDKQFNGKVLFANFSECLRVSKSIDNYFLAFCLKALYYTYDMHNFFNQTTGLQNLKMQSYLNTSLAIPSHASQTKISSFLIVKCAEIDGLIADIQAEINTLEQYKCSVITKVVTKGLNPNVEMMDSHIEWVGNIPAHWEVHPLYYYFSERKNKNKLGIETNLLSLSYGRVIRKDINTSEGLLPENYNGYNIVEKDDIVLRLTDLQNDKRSLRTGLIKEHGILTSAYVTLMPRFKIDSRFFHYVLHFYDLRKVFYNMGNGVRQGLNYDELSKCKLIAAPLNEQLEIANFLDGKCKEIDEIILKKKSQIDTLESYKKSIIFEYVTGKKEVI